MTPTAEIATLIETITGIEDEAVLHGLIKATLQSRIRAGDDVESTIAWLSELARVESAVSLPLVVVRKVVSDLAWADRAIGNGLSDSEVYLDAVDKRDANGTRLPLLIAYFVSQRLRFDFRFESLRSESRRWTDLPRDSQLTVMALFAALGLELESAPAQLTETMAEFELDEVCRDIVLQGVWFDTRLPNQADLILDISDSILAHRGASANVYFRRAAAFRRKGDTERARREIHTAIELLGPGANEVHQDYVRELELIKMTELFRDQVKDSVETQLTAALGELDRRTGAAEELVSRSMVGMVEVLGVFVALIGFLGAGAVTIINEMSLTKQILTIILLFVGSIGFFLTLRLIVRSKSLRVWRRARTQR